MSALMYVEIMDDDQQDARRRERQAFDKVIAALTKCKKDNSRGVEREAAMQLAESLWMIFLEDLSKPDNALPQQVKAKLISIGIWVLKEVVAIRTGQSDGLSALIEVNQIIRDGLE